MGQLSEWKGVKIVEAEVCPDHIHMLVEIPPKMSVAGYIGFLKGKSSLMIFQRHGNLKYKYGNRSFWCRVLRGHRRKEYEKDRAIHSKSVERRSTYRSDDVKGIHGPACG